MNGLRVKDVNYLHINFQTQQTLVSNILGFFRHRQETRSGRQSAKPNRMLLSIVVTEMISELIRKCNICPYVFKLISKSTRTDRVIRSEEKPSIVICKQQTMAFHFDELR
jgi:hypothetical protein